MRKPNQQPASGWKVSQAESWQKAMRTTFSLVDINFANTNICSLWVLTMGGVGVPEVGTAGVFRSFMFYIPSLTFHECILSKHLLDPLGLPAEVQLCRHSWLGWGHAGWLLKVNNIHILIYIRYISLIYIDIYIRISIYSAFPSLPQQH